MPNLPWGFTNSTVAVGDVVIKRYVGPDAAARRTAERAFFTAFAGVLPVPGSCRQPTVPNCIRSGCRASAAPA